jgi:prepilin-type N-terminal cleavage/methylation domain-containing protein
MKISSKKRGFSLMEVLMLVAILGIVGAAAGRALISMGKVPGQTDLSYQLETRLISKLEEIRALHFDTVAVGSPNPTLSDYVGVSGVSYPRTVTVVLADGDGNGSADATFKQVTVTLAGRSISTLISR